jgi:hypothetical protein
MINEAKSISFALKLALAALVILTDSCHPPQPTHSGSARNQEEEWSVVAFVGGTDKISQNMARADLARHGIECYMVGSLGYDIMVPQPHLEEARRILSADLRLKGLVFFRNLHKPN